MSPALASHGSCAHEFRAATDGSVYELCSDAAEHPSREVRPLTTTPTTPTVGRYGLNRGAQVPERRHRPANEDTGAALTDAPTGDYPDGLAYDPKRNAVWTTNETGGSETVIDASSSAVRGSVDLGGEVGNVVYNPALDRMVVAVQGRGDLAVIDPATLAVAARIALQGCDHPHGLALDPPAGAVFVGCDGNATMLSVDIASERVTSSSRVGEGPDVLAYDQGAHRLYVAAESGEVSVLDEQDGKPRMAGSGHLADGAHVVAVDPATHRSYYPIPSGPGGHPVLLERAPTN